MRGHIWLFAGWETNAPLTPAEADADRPLLEAVENSIPEGVTVQSMSVWIHGREYTRNRVDVTTFNDLSVWRSGVRADS